MCRGRKRHSYKDFNGDVSQTETCHLVMTVVATLYRLLKDSLFRALDLMRGGVVCVSERERAQPLIQV